MGRHSLPGCRRISFLVFGLYALSLPWSANAVELTDALASVVARSCDGGGSDCLVDGPISKSFDDLYSERAQTYAEDGNRLAEALQTTDLALQDGAGEVLSVGSIRYPAVAGPPRALNCFSLSFNCAGSSLLLTLRSDAEFRVQIAGTLAASGTARAGLRLSRFGLPQPDDIRAHADGSNPQSTFDQTKTLPAGTYELSVSAEPVDVGAGAGPGSGAADWDIRVAINGGDPCQEPGAIVGSEESESLQGTPGDDIICGLGGADEIFGGGGNDRIYGGPDGDRIFGGDGADTIEGGAGGDFICGDSDGPSDSCEQEGAGAGNDRLKGGPGNADNDVDVLRGGPGDDVIEADSKGSAAISGGSGSDEIFGSPNADLICGDVLVDFDECVDDRPGDLGVADRDLIQGGGAVAEGIVGRFDRIFGGPGHDIITGGAQRDDIDGGGGDDEIRGEAGNDRIKGGPGSDRLLGEAGNDRLQGGPGRDVVDGGPGRDFLFGGGGRDTLRARDGFADAVVDGGPGTQDEAQIDEELDTPVGIEVLLP